MAFKISLRRTCSKVPGGQFLHYLLLYLRTWASTWASSCFFTIPLSSFRSPEDDPGSKVVREIFEAVHDIRRYEQAIARLEWITVLLNDKFACSFMDEIDFILFMRRLRVIAPWRVILD